MIKEVVKVVDLIAKDQIGEALSFASNFTDVTLLKSRFQKVENDYDKGILGYDQYTVTRAKIIDSLIKNVGNVTSENETASTVCSKKLKTELEQFGLPISKYLNDRVKFKNNTMTIQSSASDKGKVDKMLIDLKSPSESVYTLAIIGAAIVVLSLIISLFSWDISVFFILSLLSGTVTVAYYLYDLLERSSQIKHFKIIKTRIENLHLEFNLNSGLVYTDSNRNKNKRFHLTHLEDGVLEKVDQRYFDDSIDKSQSNRLFKYACLKIDSKKFRIRDRILCTFDEESEFTLMKYLITRFLIEFESRLNNEKYR